VEHFVTVQTLPPGLSFPAEYSEKIGYDAERGRLVYRGVMSKADFDRLSRLSDDWSYRRPLEDLFRLSIEEVPKKPVLKRFLSAITSLGF